MDILIAQCLTFLVQNVLPNLKILTKSLGFAINTTVGKGKLKRSLYSMIIEVIVARNVD